MTKIVGVIYFITFLLIKKKYHVVVSFLESLLLKIKKISYYKNVFLGFSYKVQLFIQKKNLTLTCNIKADACIQLAIYFCLIVTYMR